MADNKFISNADSLVAAAMDREAVLSTAMDDVAFPHVRGVEGGALTLAMGVSKKGIDWGGETVKLVIGIAAIGEEHMDVLTKIADACDSEEAVDEIVAKSVDEIYDMFKRQ